MKNNCLHHHIDPDTGEMWIWCQGKCQRGYSLRSYCYHAGIELSEFLKGDFEFKEAPPNELQVMNWPARFIPMSDTRAQPGVDYLKSRGLTPECDLYYDIDRKGIVTPFYYENSFVGAQTRFISPVIHPDGEVQKMDTMPGTRLGLLIGQHNQSKFVTNIKSVGVCEGSFNAISLQQAFNYMYGGILNNPWKFVSLSGSGVTQHQKEILKEFKDQGLKVIAALDSDEAGFKGLKKLKDADCITHYAITEDTEKDWNDKLKELGHSDFARYFLSTIRKV